METQAMVSNIESLEKWIKFGVNFGVNSGVNSGHGWQVFASWW